MFSLNAQQATSSMEEQCVEAIVSTLLRAFLMGLSGGVKSSSVGVCLRCVAIN